MEWNSSLFANISVCLEIHGVKAFPHKTDTKIYLHFHVEQKKMPLKSDLFVAFLASVL